MTRADNIGGRILKLRKAAGLSQDEFAKRIGFSGRPGTVSYWEKGKREPDLTTLRKIADAFDVDSSWLILGEGTFKTRLGERVTFIRETNHLSVSEFSHELDISEQYISELENEYNVSLTSDAQKKICDTYAISKEWLTDNTGLPFSTLATLPSISTDHFVSTLTSNLPDAVSGIEILRKHPATELAYVLKYRDGRYRIFFGSSHAEPRKNLVNKIRNIFKDKSIPLYTLSLQDGRILALKMNPRTDILARLFEEPEVIHQVMPPQEVSDAGQLTQMHDHEETSVSIRDLTLKTIEILESPTIYRTALASNINAFHHSIKMAQELADMKTRMDTLEAFEKQSKKKFDELAQLIKGLQEENRILKIHRSVEDGTTIPDASSHPERPSFRKTE